MHFGGNLLIFCGDYKPYNDRFQIQGAVLISGVLIPCSQHCTFYSLPPHTNCPPQIGLVLKKLLTFVPLYD